MRGLAQGVGQAPPPATLDRGGKPPVAAVHPVRVAAALVDLSAGGVHAEMRERLLAAAAAAARRASIALLVDARDRPAVERALRGMAATPGCDPSAVRLLTPSEARALLETHDGVRFVVTTEPTSPGQGRAPHPERVSPEEGLQRLLALGWDPTVRGADPVFRPIPRPGSVPGSR